MNTRDEEKKEIWRKVYEFVATLDRDGFEMMNYGYAGKGGEEGEEAERYPHRMYGRVMGQADLRGRSVLEVGCGRGGGAAYAMRRFGPARLCGIDFSARAIEICREHHAGVEGLEFRCGDAEDLPFGGEEFDVVANVESSHCYASRPRFYGEVFRVLKPGGDFVYADFFGSLDECREALAEAGFVTVAEEDITAGVLRSLERDHERKAALFVDLPQPRRGHLENWAGLVGSPMYEAFRSRQYVYVCRHLRKPPLS
jgi:SAM-dependent methyltransferase